MEACLRGGGRLSFIVEILGVEIAVEIPLALLRDHVDTVSEMSKKTPVYEFLASLADIPNTVSNVAAVHHFRRCSRFMLSDVFQYSIIG